MNAKIGDSIKYKVDFPIGEPRSEIRTGVVEMMDTVCHSPDAYESHKYHYENGDFLVRCTSCDHWRIDTVGEYQILEISA